MEPQDGLHLPKPHNRRRILWIILGVVVLVVGGVALWAYSPKPPKEQPAEVIKKEDPPHPVSLKSRALFFGDVYWGRYINDWSQASPLKEAYPFSRLSEFGRENYDAWIADLECPTVDGVHMSSAVEDDTLQFNCSPTYLAEAAKWFTVFSNANNHSDNQGGQAGLDETRRHLDEHGIQYFGHFDPRLLSDICEVIALPVQVTDSKAQQQKGQLPVAMCGFHGVFRRPGPEAIEVMQRYANVMPVIAYPHMGAEYQPEPDQIKQDTYRAMIDSGADMVLGDHPHWVQTSEAYKGKPIIYSMGNSIFDQQYNKEVTRSAGIDITFTVEGATPQQLAAWLELGKTCAAFRDSCLQAAEEQALQRLPVAFHIKIAGTDNSGKI
ncbi:MAG TPA: CapA family protein, partial [Candidatus Saccharimonadales bacterium]|nr:CapA family protein [Candidatus Saccharimonadales bacterium]